MQILDLVQLSFGISPVETLIANQMCPLIIVMSRTNSPTTEIDCGATSQSLTPGIVNLLATQLLLRCSFIVPVQRGVGAECYVESFICRKMLGGLVGASSF